MKRESTPTGARQLIAVAALLAAASPLFAADDSKKIADPFAGAFFSPEMVLLARDRIALTQQQHDAMRARLEKTQSRSDELRVKLQNETAALATLAKKERVDEAALVAQLDKVLDVERELKHLHVESMAWIKNLLTPDQQAKLNEIAKDGGAGLAENARKRLSEKVDRVKSGAQEWAASGRDPSDIAKAMEGKFKPLIEAGKVVEAEAELDRVLARLNDGTSSSPNGSAVPREASSYQERLPPKIHKIQQELPAWSEKPGNKDKATAFMQKLKEQLDAKNFEEAEKTADSILKTMGLNAPAGGFSGENKSSPALLEKGPSNNVTKRITEKVERIEEIARESAASGRDPAEIAKAMNEKVKPLFDAGKPLEAEVELDRILARLSDKKSPSDAADAPAIPQDSSSYEERLPPKIHRIQKELPAWSEKPGNKEKAAAFMQTLKEQLDAKNFAEAEKTADAILDTIGAAPPAAQQDALQESSSLEERLPAKIQKIQKDAAAWIQETGKKDKPTALTAIALMEKLKTQIEAKNFEAAEKTADAVLKMMSGSAQAIASKSAQAATREISEETLKKVRHDLGGSFLVTRDKVQEDLKLTTEQKKELQQHLGELVPDTMRFFQKIQGLKAEDRKKELKAYRPKAQQKLAALLNETLNEDQRARLRQIDLQREGLRNGEIWKDLQVTDEQRKQFMAMMQQAQKETQLLLEEVKTSDKLKEVQPQAIKIREELEGKLEALLTDAQKTQWHEMRGKPMDQADLFDL